ncbi:TetR/AcrR family transcriptional regulator [Pseudochryseolinea flava]|uniref:TetR/AcrR family transcriptional regulator n=1 Tax=Pseudochryseolinea flava TaxID=2059302 RepID=A0A364XUL8_9BACT|nr:TetR family transcriptional regulator C-terminal domain-containing protein [Pseudochryseolinea flava]RAV98019.1 TetR/AcrR family transcriptional regulator [Pseudochryseolinea flava]
METAKKSTRKSSGKVSQDKIVNAYLEYLLSEGKQPATVFKFCLDLGIKEEEFYDHFGSFDGLEQHIWKRFADRTVLRLRADESFVTFSTREKVLAFYYTLLEELKSNRSLVLFRLQQVPRLEGLTPTYLKGFKATVEAFFESILSEGKENGEVANRPYLDKRYPQLFGLHLGFILLFWRDDNSAGFEQTDAAVEKSVNLAFDLIGKSAVDSAIDFGKFLYQTKTR